MHFFRCAEQFVQVFAGFGGDGDFVCAPGNVVGVHGVALVVALQHRGTGLGQLADQLVRHGHVIVPLGVAGVDDVEQQVGVLQLLQRGLEGLH